MNAIPKLWAVWGGWHDHDDGADWIAAIYDNEDAAKADAEALEAIIASKLSADEKWRQIARIDPTNSGHDLSSLSYHHDVLVDGDVRSAPLGRESQAEIDAAHQAIRDRIKAALTPDATTELVRIHMGFPMGSFYVANRMLAERVAAVALLSTEGLMLYPGKHGGVDTGYCLTPLGTQVAKEVVEGLGANKKAILKIMAKVRADEVLRQRREVGG